jgi:hypothetical protein
MGSGEGLINGSEANNWTAIEYEGDARSPERHEDGLLVDIVEDLPPLCLDLERGKFLLNPVILLKEEVPCQRSLQGRNSSVIYVAQDRSLCEIAVWIKGQVRAKSMI